MNNTEHYNREKGSSYTRGTTTLRYRRNKRLHKVRGPVTHRPSSWSDYTSKLN